MPHIRYTDRHGRAKEFYTPIASGKFYFPPEEPTLDELLAYSNRKALLLVLGLVVLGACLVALIWLL